MDRIGKMHFGEFNPLDVLAAAASLQSVQLPDTEPENNGAGDMCQEVQASDDDDTADDTSSSDVHVAVSSDVTVSDDAPVTLIDNDVSNNNYSEYGISSKLHIVSVLSNNESGMGRKQSAPSVIHVVDEHGDIGDTVATVSDVNSTVTLVDGGRQTLTTTPLKAVALQTSIGRFARMITDHSYTFLHRHTDASRTKTDEDEGYCSRSSLDSPGQGSRSDSDAWDQEVFDQRDGDNRDTQSCRILLRQNSKRDSVTTPVVLLSPPVTCRSPCTSKSDPVTREPLHGSGDYRSSTPMPVVTVINGCKVIQDAKGCTGCDSLSPGLGNMAGKLFIDGSIDQEGACSTTESCANPIVSAESSSVEPTQDASRCVEDTDTDVGTEHTLSDTMAGTDITSPDPVETIPVEENIAVKDTVGDQFEVASKVQRPLVDDVIDAGNTDCKVQSECERFSNAGYNEQEERDCIMLENSASAEPGIDGQQFSAEESVGIGGDKNSPQASVHFEPDIASSSDVLLLSDTSTRLESRNAIDISDDTPITCPVIAPIKGSVDLPCIDEAYPTVRLQPSFNVGEAINKNETNVVVMDTDCDCTGGQEEEASVPVISDKLAVVPGSSCDDVKSSSQETGDQSPVAGAQGGKTSVVNKKESTDSLCVTVSVMVETESMSGDTAMDTITGSGYGDTQDVTETDTESGHEDTQDVTETDTEPECGNIQAVTDSGNIDALPVTVVKSTDTSGVKVTESVINPASEEPLVVTTGQTRSDDASAFRTPESAKTVVGTGFQMMHKSGHQYIIEDDVSPMSKFYLSAPRVTEDDSYLVSDSTSVGQPQQGSSPKGSDAWKLLGTYDQKGLFVSNSRSVSTEQKDVDVCSVNSRAETLMSKCDMSDGHKESDMITSDFSVDQHATSVTLGSTHGQTDADAPDTRGADDVLALGQTNQSEFESLVLQTISDVMPSLQSGCRTGDTVIPKINNCDDVDAEFGPTSSFRSVIGGGSDSEGDKSRSALLASDSSNNGSVLGSPLRMSSDSKNDSNDREVATLTLADGRITPVHQSPSLGLHGLEMSPCEQINIKIAGGKVVGLNLLDDGMARKATTSIGTVGSLQWTSLPQVASTKRGRPMTKSPYSINSGSFIPIPDNRPSVATLTSSQIPTQVDFYEGQPFTPRVLLDGTCKNSQSQSKTLLSARTCHMYMRKKLKQQSEASSRNLGVDLSRMKQSAETILQLHPLIDHDYCMFTEFSADIQSSIIATTESKLKTDKKYTKKTKAARTTKSEPFITPTPVERVPVVKLKKRKYVRRKGIVAVGTSTAEDKKLKRAELLRMRETVSDNDLPTVSEFDMKKRDERKLAKTKVLLTRRRSDRNYVKITGSYQDEFVYFATKKTRGRPRKSVDTGDVSQAKLPPVSGISVFDWYRDLSKTDKSSRFGMLDTAVDEGRPSIPSVSPTASTSCSIAGRTPIHESEVVDLVMDLMPNTALGNSKLFQPYMNSSNQASKGDLDESTASGVEGGKALPVEDEQVELNMMAEQVRMMLNSMGEAELKMWEEKLSDSNGDKSSSFPDVAVSQGETPTSTSTHLLDLDDINDNDLLSTDIGNMTVILGDLTAPKPAIETGLSIAPGSNSSDLLPAKLDVASASYNFDKNTATLNMLFNDTVSIDQSNGFGPDLSEVNKTQIEYNPAQSTTVGLNSLFGEAKLDRYELFPDIATSDVTSSISSTMSASQSSAPELTVVSMFWNDLPGLTIRNKKYVRLVDIHKQILPAKDTGILKKRCQMMGLEVANCSELERDFLIRYANAVKSKSTVIVPQDAAQQLIGFYVNPRPRMSRFSSSSDDHRFEQMDKCRKSSGSEVTLKPHSSTKKSADGENEAVIMNDAMQDLPEKAQLVDTNGRIRQIIIGRRKYGRTATRRKRKASSSSDNNKPKRKRVGGATQNTLTLKASNKASACVNAVKRSTRLKYQKGHYVAMLQGLCRKDIVGIKDNVIEKAVSPAMELDSRGDNGTTPVALRPCKIGRWSAFHTNHISTGKKVVEELELRKMRTLQKKRRLTSVEKLRMKKLRKRLRKKMIVQEPLRCGRKQKLVAGMVAVATAAAGKRHQKLGLKSKKLNGAGVEHCYAAAVATSEGASATDHDSVASQPQLGVGEPQQLLQIVSYDCDDRKGCCQTGMLRLLLYLRQESLCIACDACDKLLSVDEFLHHQHKAINEQLQAASRPHEIRVCSTTPLSWETALWNEFQKKRQTFSGATIKHINDAAVSLQPDKKEKLLIGEKPMTEFDALSTRHSKRVRKRKQLHPIERYVFSKLYTATEEEEEEDVTGEGDSSLEVVPLLPGEAPSTAEAVAMPVVSCRNKPKLTQRRDSKTLPESKQQKYGLRVCSPEEPRKRRRL